MMRLILKKEVEVQFETEFDGMVTAVAVHTRLDGEETTMSEVSGKTKEEAARNLRRELEDLDYEVEELL